MRNTSHRAEVHMTGGLLGWSNKKHYGRSGINFDYGRGIGSIVVGWGWLATAVLDSLAVP